MASAWDVAAVVGPLVLAFIAMIVSSVVSASPAATAFFQRWTRRVLGYFSANRGRCQVLSWKDIPPGGIHGCHSSCQHISRQPIKSHDPASCWEESVGKVFNRLFPSGIEHSSHGSNTATKPYQLPFFQDFIQTDAQTLKAFFLLTLDNCRTCQIVDLKSLMEIKAFGGVLTVHLKAGPLAPANTALTKFEVERMIGGYSPFYRSTILTPGPGGFRVEHPILETKHTPVSRGAWILAVGLSVNIGPVPSLYNMQQLREKNDEEYWKGTLVMSAFDMIGETLRQLRDLENSHLTSQHQRQDVRWNGRWGDHALDCYNLIMNPAHSRKPWVLKTQDLESQALFRPVIGECPCTRICLDKKPHAETCGRGQLFKKDAARRLSPEQCKAALEIFNNYIHSEENLDIIAPVLAEVFQTVILGMSEVERYFSKVGQKLDFPEILKEKRHIYLRTCAVESEY